MLKQENQHTTNKSLVYPSILVQSSMIWHGVIRILNIILQIILFINVYVQADTHVGRQIDRQRCLPASRGFLFSFRLAPSTQTEAATENIYQCLIHQDRTQNHVIQQKLLTTLPRPFPLLQLPVVMCIIFQSRYWSNTIYYDKIVTAKTEANTSFQLRVCFSACTKHIPLNHC